MEIVLENMTAFLLVFVRMAGMILFNPVFSRKNVPSQIRMGFILCLTILITPTIEASQLAAFSEFDVVAAMLKELAIGVVCGYVFQFFYYLLFFAGDLLDMQFGLSMAKIFDPGSNIQMSVSGNLLNIIFMLYLFATDSHLLLIKIMASSYQIIPAGATGLSLHITSFMLDLFISAFSLIIKLILPFIVAELIVEISMGVLMKLIPQIHVFVINIQFKLLFGMFMLLAFAHPVSAFVDNYIFVMFESIQKALHQMVA
ncbi:flagellar biosynthetic protein FliR [Oscillospiraceae bacterium PP1C4]